MDIFDGYFIQTMAKDLQDTCISMDSVTTHYLPFYCLASYCAYTLLLLIKRDIAWSVKNGALFVMLCTSTFLMQYAQNLWLNTLVTVTVIGLQWNWMDPKFLCASNKAVLITGCDRGIGHELAKRLDSMGYQVFAGCLFAEGQGQLALQSSCSRNLKILQLDVTNSKQVNIAAEQVKAALGNKELWGIVNNAGVCFIGNIETMTAEDINKIMSVNIMGPINICRAFFPLLRKSKGRLVNIASNTGLAPIPLLGVYCASKSALATFSEVMRYEMQVWGIRVSTVIPSGYRTGILAYDKDAVGERWWKSAPIDVRQDYGKHCFTPQFKMKNHVEVTSPDLNPIVNTIVHALFAKFPRTYYYSGLLARSLPFIYLHLPTVLCDPLMKLIGDWFEFHPDALRKGKEKLV